MDHIYDVIILGAGPAGLSAGLYAGRSRLDTLIIEKGQAGGQIINTDEIENYPGQIVEGETGVSLVRRMYEQTEQFGAEHVRDTITNAELSGDIKVLTGEKDTYQAKNIIIATGAYAKSLHVNNETQFLGKGLSYCATCDGNFFKDKIVTVVGGGNTSMVDCLYLSNIAKKIYLVHRREVFRAQEGTLNKVKALALGKNAKIEILTNYVVTDLIGDEKLQKIEILNKLTNEKRYLQTDGIFIAIGRKPDTELFATQVKLTNDGFIETNEKMQTNLKNVYAIGDVRNTTLRQIVTACSDGAVAVMDFVREN